MILSLISTSWFPKFDRKVLYLTSSLVIAIGSGSISLLHFCWRLLGSFFQARVVKMGLYHWIYSYVHWIFCGILPCCLQPFMGSLLPYFGRSVGSGIVSVSDNISVMISVKLAPTIQLHWLSTFVFPRLEARHLKKSKSSIGKFPLNFQYFLNHDETSISFIYIYIALKTRIYFNFSMGIKITFLTFIQHIVS